MSNNLLIHPTTIIHPTSIVDEGASIGEECRIWHWVHICGKASIGKHCSFGQNVYVGNNVQIGNNVRVQNNVSIYDNVSLEDNVFCGPSMVFTNVYNPRSEIPRKDEYRNTTIKKGATLGANCTIICGTTVHEYAFVAAGSLVRTDIKPFELVAGVPSKQIGWMSAFGERINLPNFGQGEWVCPKTEELYILRGNNLFRENITKKI